MDDLLKPLRDWCQHLGTNRTYWIAYSGGLDSTVLLHLAAALPAYSFKAIHIHHGLHPQADAWALHCELTAKQLCVPFVIERLHLPSLIGVSLEAQAREARYACFAKHMQAGDVILTAHHQDDQAETVLLQLTRGAGPQGLAAMPVSKPFHIGTLVRPCLGVSRDALLSYATQASLSWVDDTSNACTDYSRNFIRHEILPIFKSRWPSMASTLARSARHCAESQTLLSDLLRTPLKQVAGHLPKTLSVSALNQHAEPMKKALIREWIMQAGHEPPSTKKLATILNSVLTAAWDKSPCVSFGVVSVRRHKDHLHLVLNEPIDLGFTAVFDLKQPLPLSKRGCLRPEISEGVGYSAAIASLTVKYRQGGEVIALAGRGRQRLKNLFQEVDALPWERDYWPLLYDGESLVGVAGMAYHEDYLAKAGEPGVVVIWER